MMGMRVGELARRTGVGVSTLRAWESRFRFLQPQRSPAGHRVYLESDVGRVEAVLRLGDDEIVAALGAGVPAARRSCATLPLQVLRRALGAER